MTNKTSFLLQSIQQNLQKKEIRHTKFTDDEDSQLCALVQQYGMDSWDKIAAMMGNQRTKRQLRERWQNYLNPELVLSYTEDEDCALVRLYSQVGPQWAKIAAVLGKKSAISTRNRYRSLQSMKARGVKPDYAKVDPMNQISVTDSMESSVFEITDLTDFDFNLGIGIGLGDSWESDFSQF
jgi:hypothetical protein